MKHPEIEASCLICGTPLMAGNPQQRLTCSDACSRELVARVKRDLEPAFRRRSA
jgi:hypothetical protein